MDIVVNPSFAGNFRQRLDTYTQVLMSTVGRLTFPSPTITGRAAGAGVGTVGSVTADVNALVMRTNVANAFSLSGVRFSRGAEEYVVKSDGSLQINPSPVTGNGTTVGSMTPAQGYIQLDAWAADSSPIINNWRAVAAAPVNGANSPYGTYLVTFRTAVAPLRTGSMSILGNMRDGTTFNVVADSNGYINTPRIKGRVNYTTGVAKIVGVTPTGAGGQTQSDLSFLGIPGLTLAYIDLIEQESLRYNAVAYSYLPLDSELLGIDPVRLPSDGRVPIFRPGELAVVGHTAMTSPVTAVNGGTISAGRVRLSRARIIGNNGVAIPSGYTENLETGVITFTNVAGWSQPVRLEHRIEDMGLMRDAQIDGRITFTRPLTHNYPPGSFVSSALRSPDLKARVRLIFDQQAWDNVSFLDTVVGNPAGATYNSAAYPIEVTNAGAYTEEWVFKFKSNQAFDIIGEHVGNIGEGSILTVTSPINDVTGEPYFTIPVEGWGSGWSSGNILRVSTVGAMFPVWMVRTTQQGPENAADYSFLTIVRGDVDNPL